MSFDQHLDLAKKAAGKQAAQLIQPGMVVGLGTGSTAACFISELAIRCREGLHIQAVATSRKSFDQAYKESIPLIDINGIVKIDVTVDGADQVDPLKQMIKGAGGALLREKIVAAMSTQLIIVVDESKLSLQLGGTRLPIEVLPFGCKGTVSRLEHLGLKGSLRAGSNKELYVTENGNYIYDADLPKVGMDPQQLDDSLKQVPGVIETGFFLNFSARVIVGFKNGEAKEVFN